jgi:hypothetical protein
MRPDRSFLLLAWLPLLAGCGFTVRAGTGAAFHTAGPITLEGRGTLGVGIAAGKATAILVTGSGSVGGGVRGGGLAGSAGGGIEYLIGPTPWGGRVGVGAGYRGDEDGGNPFAQIGGGVTYALDQADSYSRRSVTAVGIDASLGHAFASIKPPYPQGTLVGVGVSIEFDVLNEFTIPINHP